MNEKWIRQAENAIKRDDALIYDAASSVGQIVGNVKHMHWFKIHVAKWIAGDRWEKQ